MATKLHLDTWRVLHIDDDEDDHVLVKAMLGEARGQAVSVDWAPSIAEGRKKLAANNYQAVLVDYDLGIATGIELIQEFVAAGYAAPMILLTGRGSYEVDVEAMRVGATLYLTKNEINPLLLERSLRYAIERKQTEQDLRERDQKLSVALDAAQLGAWTYTFSDDKFELDHRAQQMYRASSRVVSHAWIVDRYLHPEDITKMEAALAKATDPQGDGRYQVEYRIMQCPEKRQGENDFCWLNAWGLAEFEGQGEDRHAVRLIGASRDITWEKQAQLALEKTNDALRESEVRLSHLADAMPQLVWTAKPDGRVDYYNQRYKLYGGIAPIKEDSWEWGPALHPDDVQLTVDAWNTAVQTGNVYQVEHRVRMAGGGYRWHLSRGIPAHDSAGQLVKWYGTATDIHDFKQIQEALRQREQRLSRLYESSLIGIITRDSSGKVLEANEAYLKIIGRTREEVEAGEVWISDITPPEYHQQDRQINNQILSEGFCKPFEKEFVLKNGSRVPVLIGYSLFEGEQAEFIGYVLDLSELKQAQAELAGYAEKLKRSNEELENFAFLASHDLQEPLRKIMLFGNGLRRQLGSQLAEESNEYLNRMENAAQRMQDMISGLLDLSRVSKNSGEFERVDLTDLVSEVTSDLELRIDATGGLVQVENLPCVQGDSVQLRQLFFNLVGNALKYHKPGLPPVVHISGEMVEFGKNQQIRITVADNGIGFEESDAERIFLPFERLHGRNYDGSGIGLAICRKIVERHGGSIMVYSQPNAGSQFIITLPIE